MMNATRLTLLLGACTRPNMVICKAPVELSDVPESVATDVAWTGDASAGDVVVTVRTVGTDFARAVIHQRTPNASA